MTVELFAPSRNADCRRRSARGAHGVSLPVQVVMMRLFPLPLFSPAPPLPNLSILLYVRPSVLFLTFPSRAVPGFRSLPLPPSLPPSLPRELTGFFPQIDRIFLSSTSKVYLKGEGSGFRAENLGLG